MVTLLGIKFPGLEQSPLFYPFLLPDFIVAATNSSRIPLLNKGSTFSFQVIAISSPTSLGVLQFLSVNFYYDLFYIFNMNDI